MSATGDWDKPKEKVKSFLDDELAEFLRQRAIRDGAQRSAPQGEEGDPSNQHPSPDHPAGAGTNTGWVKPLSGFQPWGNPVDFWKESQVPEMRPEWMPHALRDLILYESESWAADPGIYTMFGLGICAGALSNAHKIQVRADDPSSLRAARMWILVNAYSGSGKTPILSAMASPLKDKESELMEQVAFRLKQYIDDKEIYEKRRQAYITSQAKNEGGNRPEEPPKPDRNRLIVYNATIEAVLDLLSEQGQRGITGLYDEIISLVGGANQYKKGGNDIQEILKLREGGKNAVDRKGTVTLIAENAMNIVGGTQPDAIRKAVQRHDLTSNGFIQRFNVYTGREAGLELDRASRADFDYLAEIVGRLHGLQSSAPVQYSPEAQTIRRQFVEWCYYKSPDRGVADAFKSHLGKMRDQFSEYCLLYHAIESVENRCLEIAPTISAKTADQVRQLFQDCLYPHAQAFYFDVLETSSETMKNVRLVAAKILAKDWKTIDLRQLSHAVNRWRTFKPWEKRAVLTMLTEGGWIQSSDPRGYVEGSPFKAVVHPNLITIFGEYAAMEKARLEQVTDQMHEQFDD